MKRKFCNRNGTVKLKKNAKIEFSEEQMEEGNNLTLSRLPPDTRVKTHWNQLLAAA